MKYSIRAKILASFGVLILLLIVIQIIFNFFFLDTYFMSQKRKAIEDAFYQIKDAYSEDLEPVDEIADSLLEMHGIKLVLADGERIVYTKGYSSTRRNMYTVSHLREQGAEFNESPSFITINKRSGNVSILYLTAKFSYKGETVYVMMNLFLAAIDNSVSIFTTASLGISTVTLLIGIIVSILLSRSIISPIISVEAVAKKVSDLDFSQYANEEVSSRELSDLAVSINIMSRRLKRSIEELQTLNEKLKKDIDYQKQIEQLRREFVANVSHEMKTPLGLLQIYSENLKSDMGDIDREYYCDVIIEETKNLDDMVKSMLDISSIESGFSRMNFEMLDLSCLCKETVNKFLPALQNYEFECSVDDNIWISGDRKYMEQAMQNYLSNAIRHTEVGRKIEVSLTEKLDIAVFSVRNQGKTIADGDLPYIWSAFYKADKARTRTQENNVGLGLYIVKTVVEKHRGEYGAANREDGVEFVFSIPIAKK